MIGDGDFSEESSAGWFRRSNSAKFASSFSGGFDLTSVKSSETMGFHQVKKPVVVQLKGKLQLPLPPAVMIIIIIIVWIFNNK